MVNVGIYIYTDSIADLSSVFVTDFISRVQTNGGTFESGNCLLSELQNLGGSLGVASQAKRLELFNDEKISITSSISNVNDFGKVFTDFSQSFNIPASKVNNKILSHWYESSLENGFDHRKRYDAYIEVDTVLFKNGNIQLEKVNQKNGFIESYSVTFYGNLTQIKDIIQDDKLASLDFSVYNHIWDAANVQARIESVTTTGDIKYPLIGSKRKFYYQDVVHASEDVTTTAGAINWNELFPAIKVSNIFLKIKEKYGVEFTGSFLSEEQFKKLYLYLKPSTELNFLTEPLKLNFTSTAGVAFPELNLSTDTLTTNFNYSTNPGNSNRIKIALRITPTSSYLLIPYTIYVYKNDILFTTLSNLVGVTNSLLDDFLQRDTGNIVNKYTFSLSSASSFYFTPLLTYQRLYINYSTFAYVYLNSTATSSVQNTVANIQIGNYIPDMKIQDFLTGIVKAFNLMIIPKGNNVFDLSHLEMYYNAGKIIDVTEYIYSKEMEIERPKLFKSVSLTYENSSNILNNAYKGIYNNEYGDLIYKPVLSNESNSYDIKLPFENVLFERTVGTQFLTATIIDKDLKPYVPKPMLIYCNGILPNALTGTDRIQFKTPSTYIPLTNYNRFSNEFNNVPTDLTYSYLMTMNFNNEQSPWYNVLAPQGLYYRHYKNYIENLYNLKTRIVKVKGFFPPSLLDSKTTNAYGKNLGIALNDRLIIRDKRYIINTYTIDITTGEANLELITDYRGVDAAKTAGYKFASMPDVQVDKTAQTVEQIIYLNDYDSFAILPLLETFLILPVFTEDFQTQDLPITIDIAENTSGIDRYDSITVAYLKDGFIAAEEQIIFLQTGI
jgi:hypothetical protein